MRVAWVCEYPAFQFADRPALARTRMSHPLPWITMQAPLLAQTPFVELHIVTIGKDFSGDDDFVHNGVHFHFRRVPPLPRALVLYQIDRFRIWDCLDRIGPDLVQGFGTEAGYSYAAATSRYRALLRIQGVQSEINAALPVRVLVKHPRFLVPALFERFTIQRCHDYLCPTAFAARVVKRINPQARVHFVKTPVRPEAFSVLREPAPAGAPELLFVGSVIPAKGIEVLLEAMALVAGKHPRVRLHVVGSGEEHYIQGTLMSLINRLGIRSHVALHGQLSVAGLVPFWSSATMLVLPTFMDTAPNVVAEAQVAGIPVVATAVGGIPEMVEHGVSGLLVGARAPGPLADAILRLLDDPKVAWNLARVAKERARAEHQPVEQVRKLVNLYRELIATPLQGQPQTDAQESAP